MTTTYVPIRPHYNLFQAIEFAPYLLHMSKLLMRYCGETSHHARPARAWLMLNRLLAYTSCQTSDAVLELAVHGGVDEGVDAAVGEHNHHSELVEPAHKRLRCSRKDYRFRNHVYGVSEGALECHSRIRERTDGSGRLIVSSCKRWWNGRTSFRRRQNFRTDWESTRTRQATSTRWIQSKPSATSRWRFARPCCSPNCLWMGSPATKIVLLVYSILYPRRVKNRRKLIKKTCGLHCTVRRTSHRTGVKHTENLHWKNNHKWTF